MAPALAKILKNGHGIHLSSPPASVGVDQSSRARYDTEPRPPTSWIEDGDLEMMWQNLSSFPILDSYVPLKTLDSPGSLMFSPHSEGYDCHCDVDVSLSPASLVEALTSNKGQRQSHPANSAFPGVPGMFSAPAPEHNSQEACLLHEQRTAPECGPDGYDTLLSSLAHTSVLPSKSHWEINSQGCAPLLVTPASLTHAKITAMGHPPPPPGQTWPRRVAMHHLPSKSVQQEAIKKQLSRQAGLHERAGRLQRRLFALLGEYTVKHCNQQLEGLKERCQKEKEKDSYDSLSVPQPSEHGRNAHFLWPTQPDTSCLLQEVTEFSHSSQVVLRGLQEALDSDATANSSSDEEPDFARTHEKTSPHSHCKGREWHWLKERAELGSRWSWLQLRITELEGRIQELSGVYDHIRSNKCGVVLADSKPVAECQSSHAQGSQGSSFTDADAEPCSPTRLLHNIEEQTAQMNQIVNSLMPHFSFSPLSKQTNGWKRNQTINRLPMEGEPFKARKTLRTRRNVKPDASCTCARTRPLVFFQKPKLFTFDRSNANRLQDSGGRRSNLSSCPSPSSCLCSSCDPVVLSSDHNSSSCCSVLSSSSTSSFSSKPHLVPPLAFGKPSSHQSQRVGGREEWFLRPLVASSQRPSPAEHHSLRSTLPTSHKKKQYVKHRKRLMNLSPSPRSHHSKTSQRKPKRPRSQRAMDEDFSHLLCDLEETSDEVFDENQVYMKPNGQAFMRKRQGESAFSINSVFLPTSLTKVEKLQCKNILTPRWRVIEMDPIHSNLPEDEMDEDVGDEAFTQRHQPMEVKEKLLWSSWGKRKRSRRSTGTGSRMSGCEGGMCTSREDRSLDRSSAQLGVNEQALPPLSEEEEEVEEEEWLPQTPWKPRVFPLNMNEEATLLSDPLDWSEAILVSLSKNLSSDLPPAQSPRPALPSPGWSKLCIH